jgi:predicted hotdog family 3-hydroxylacyl-ACP dehydratase
VSHTYFPIGTHLQVNVQEIVTGDQGLSVFECTLHGPGDISASANINVFQPEDPEQFLQSGQVG